MTEIIAEEKIIPSDFEIKMGGISRTINTLRKLKKENPDDSFTFIIGSDQLYEFKKWDLWEDLIKEFGVDLMNRIGNLSAGEVRRTQIIASLAVPRDLVIIDEITAVLDIVGRKKCMRVLDQERRDRGTTIVLATNILEDVHLFATHILLLSRGKVKSFASLDSFLSGSDRSHFSDRVVYELETK
jgi:ABC-type multidrug transport system ATPase subunit